MAHPRPIRTVGSIQGTGVNVYGGGGSGGYGGGGGNYTIIAGKRVALLNDMSNHGGKIVTHNQDGKAVVAGIPVAVAGALHYCPLIGHGTLVVTPEGNRYVTVIAPITTRSKINNKLILTQGAVAALPCGALIQPPDRKVYVE